MSPQAIIAGRYRHRITITAAPADASRDAYGRRKGAGSSVGTFWAEKQDWAGQETTENGRETPSITTRFKLRWRPDIKANMTVTHGSDVYDILSVMDLPGTKRELQLTCRRVAA